MKAWERIQETPRRFAARPFLVEPEGGKVWTFGEVDSAARSVLAGLRAKGLKKGDRVAVCSDNSTALAVFYFACLYGGLPVVPVNPVSSEEELSYMCQTAGVKLFAVSDKLPNVGVAGVEKWSIESADRAVRNDVVPFAGVGEDDELVVIFTSGTTSLPKGVIHRYRDLTGNALAFGERMGITTDSRFLNLLPMTYLGGYYNLMLLPWVNGASTVILPTFNPALLLKFWKVVSTYEVNTLWFVPSILALLLRMDRTTDGESYVREKVRVVLCGTAPLPKPVREEFERRYGARIFENFGLSETLFLTTELPSEKRGQGSVGKLMPGVKIRCLDDADKEVPPGTEGEMWIESPWLMTGYLGHPPLPKTAFPTGDLGVLYPDGTFSVTGRKKDLIIRGGINISPASVEDVVQTHPKVEECAVVGVANPLSGEDVVAVVKVSAGSDFTAVSREILQLCQERLSKHKLPSRVVSIPEIPRTYTGKIQKNKIRTWVARSAEGAPHVETPSTKISLRPSKVVADIADALSIRFNNRVYDLKRSGVDVITLSLGEAFFDIPLYSFEPLPFPELYHYSHSRGIPELRHFLARYFEKEYEVSFNPETEILLTAGSKIAIYMSLLALLNPADEAIILEPAWVSYSEQVRLCHAVPVMVPYDCPLFELEKHVTNRTRVLIINSPNNPTGRIYSLEELSFLHRLAQKHNLYVLSDEAYSDFLDDSSRFVSMGNLDRDKGHSLIVNSISKNFGISGWRIGYVITNAALTSQILKVNQHLVTCAPTILQQYVVKYFDDILSSTRPQIQKLLEARRKIAAHMDTIGLKRLEGDATFYFFVSIAPSSLDSMAFCERLLNEHHVCAVPGIGYGPSCGAFIRVGVGTESHERIVKGLEAIRSLIEQTSEIRRAS